MKKLKYFKSAMLLTGLILIVLIGTSSCGDTPASASAAAPIEKNAEIPGAGNDANDIYFLVQATGINLEEIRLGEVAEEKGTMKDIRELGKMMVTQHTKVLNDLTALAARKSITIPTMLSDKATADYEKLNALTGIAFDRQYADMMVSGHQDAIALFEKESAGAVDPDIRQWAAGVLPGLHMHLNHAMACQDKLKNTASK
jgi:putative membrane protein